MAPGTIRRATQGDHATIVSFNKCAGEAAAVESRAVNG